MGNIPISWSLSEESLLTLQRFFQTLADRNVLLRTVNDTDKAEFQWIDASSQNLESISPVIHEVQFCKNTDCSLSSWIDLTSEFESFRVDEIDIGRRYREDDAYR